MSLLSKAAFATAPKPLLWLAGILLLTTLASAGATWYYHGELADAETLATTVDDRHKAEIAAKDLRISELTGANQFEHTVVEELGRRLREAIGQQQQAAQGLATAIDQRDRARRERDHALSQFRQAQEAIYANDEACAEWGARPVCGRISDGVWQRWEDARGSAAPASEDGAAGDPGAPAGADRPDPDRRPAPGAGADSGHRVQPAGVHATHGLFLEPAAGDHAKPSVGLGRRVGGQPAGHPPGQRRGHEAAPGGHRETAVTLIVLEYPDDATAARIFDDLHRAGALNRSHFTPAVTVIADTSDPRIAAQLKQRMRRKGLSGESDMAVIRQAVDNET